MEESRRKTFLRRLVVDFEVELLMMEAASEEEEEFLGLDILADWCRFLLRGLESVMVVCGGSLRM